MTTTFTTLRSEIDQPSNVTELTHVFKVRGALAFEDGYHHYLHPSALSGVHSLTIKGLRDAEIHLLSPLSGDAFYRDAYLHDSGTLNLVDCQNVVISGAFVNTRPYNGNTGSLSDQTGNAVNIARSTVKFVNTKIFSAARMPIAIHSGSTVEIEDSIIEGDYFCVFNGASSVTLRRCELVQDADYPDSHPNTWVSSSHRSGVDNVLYENSFTLFDGCRFKLKSGRSLVGGNGSYETRSEVEYRNCEIIEKDENFGIVSWVDNYHSITVNTDGKFGGYTEDLLRVGPGTSGFARFVDYYQDVGGKPGGPGDVSPIIVDGVSSEGLGE